jgi:hypothetical protein
MKQKQPSTLTQKALKVAGIGAATGALLFGGKRLLKKEVASVAPVHPKAPPLLSAPKPVTARSIMEAKRRAQAEKAYATAKTNHAKLSERLAKQPNHSKLKKAVADAKAHMENLHRQLSEEPK